jgi:hypothetical protein
MIHQRKLKRSQRSERKPSLELYSKDLPCSEEAQEDSKKQSGKTLADYYPQKRSNEYDSGVLNDDKI